MNTWDKYLRFALGIPLFCLGVSGWILFDEVALTIHSFWDWIKILFSITIMIYLGLKLLDVPAQTNITVNLNNKKEE